MNIVDFIPTGEQNRVKSKYLEQITGLRGPTIRREINKKRAEFCPIASDKRGYYIAETPEELNHTIAQLNHRIHMMIVAREGLKKAQQLLREEQEVIYEHEFGLAERR